MPFSVIESDVFVAILKDWKCVVFPFELFSEYLESVLESIFKIVC